MGATSGTYSLSTLPGTPSAISSPESEAGPVPSASQTGPMINLAGPDRVLASLSARQAKERGLMTSGTYGPPSSTSSNSASLQSSLESRLPARLDSRGSTLFKLTWTHRVTPQGRSISALRASGLRTSVSVYSGVPTPCGQDGPKGGPGQGADQLPGAAALAAVPSPCTPNGGRSMSIEKMDATGKTLDGRKHTSSLEHVVKFSAVPTPNTPSGGPNPRSTPTHTGGMDLEGAASLASVATPAARDYKSNSSSEEFQSQQWSHPREKPLSAQATLVDSGEDVTGGTAATKSSGQLNPEYSRWLQGYPSAWGNCADTVMLLSRRSRQNS